MCRRVRWLGLVLVLEVLDSGGVLGLHVRESVRAILPPPFTHLEVHLEPLGLALELLDAIAITQRAIDRARLRLLLGAAQLGNLQG